MENFHSLLQVICGICLLSSVRANNLPADWRKTIANDTFAYSVQHFQRPLVGPHSASAQTGRTFVEGDIRTRPTSNRQRPQQGQRFFNAVVGETQTWPRGIVPYFLASEFSWPERDLIKAAISDIEQHTCVRFLEYPGGMSYVSHSDYVKIEKTEGTCSSYVGRMSIGEQDVQLAAGCLKLIGEVQHELLHVLGLYHEQSRMDRDRYVYIVRENIFNGGGFDYAGQFDKYESNTFGLPYDYESIMHYGHNYFSRSAHLPTIVPRSHQRGKPVRMGNREKMTDIDAQKISYLYKCLHISYEQNPAATTAASHFRHVSRHRPTAATRRPIPTAVPSIAASLSEEDLYRLRKNKYNESKNAWRRFKDAVKAQGEGGGYGRSARADRFQTRRYRDIPFQSTVASAAGRKSAESAHLGKTQTSGTAPERNVAYPLSSVHLIFPVFFIFSALPF